MIDGSALNYTVTYSDALSGTTCGMATIPAVFCNYVCSHVFDITSSPCYKATNISITVSASNILGDGPPSRPSFAIIENQSEYYDNVDGKMEDCQREQ